MLKDCCICHNPSATHLCLNCSRPICSTCWKKAARGGIYCCRACLSAGGPAPATSSPRPAQPSTGAQAQQQERGTFMGNILQFPKPGKQAQPHETNADGQPLTTSEMTQEQLRARRIRRVESAKVARPLHETVMLFALKLWLVLGPPAFVVLTVFEVAYIFSSLLPPGDSGDKIIFFGALFVDLAMMFTTFGVSIKRRDLAEKRELHGSVAN